MRTHLFFLALATSADAIVTRWTPCCFHLSSSGAVTGTVGQLDDGQNRINGPLSPAQFCIADGAITDAHGRGCIITPGVTQYQCDSGVPPASGFSVGCDGAIAYNGQTTFWECQTGDRGTANIYIHPGGTNCGQITLKADSCFSGCHPPPPPPSGCLANLNGQWEFPHLIVPIDYTTPNIPAGTSYFGEVSSTISSIYNFDIPASDAGKTCSLIFLFPTQAQLTTSSFTFSGNGGISFSQLDGVATNSTTYATAPGDKTFYGVTIVSPGNSYTIASFPCPAGQAVSYELKAVGDTYLRDFQDWNPSPIGVYITKC
ncbi:GPI anchored cell wall protein [Leptodontidium sp. MPI-SDFR-AT-0119]|nr:GPI anchored cell wall protein [Leptodontidium sp. MPI-SDFR-AT-0119]